MTVTTPRFPRALARRCFWWLWQRGCLRRWRRNPAEAAFPGANGTIAFSSNRTRSRRQQLQGDYEIFAMKPDGTGLAAAHRQHHG